MVVRLRISAGPLIATGVNTGTIKGKGWGRRNKNANPTIGSKLVSTPNMSEKLVPPRTNDKQREEKKKQEREGVALSIACACHALPPALPQSSCSCVQTQLATREELSRGRC